MPYTNLGISIPTPHDPSQSGVWAQTVNTNMSLLDAEVSGIQAVSVTSANVILTANNGSADQNRNTHFELSGAMTGNRTLFFAGGRTQKFSIYNGCTGGYTLTIAVNNGSGSPAGATQTLGQGNTGTFVSDGTNITPINQYPTIVLPVVSVPNDGTLTTIGPNPVTGTFLVSGSDGAGNNWTDFLAFREKANPGTVRASVGSTGRIYSSDASTGVLQLELTGGGGPATVTVILSNAQVYP